MNIEAFHNLSYGLYIICALDGEGRKVGCVANTFIQVASEPPTSCVALNKENVTTQAILETGRYTATCLSINATMELIGRFGFKSSYEIDKFDGTAFRLDEWGVPYIDEASNAFFSAEAAQTVDAGSHIMFIGEVVGAEVLSDAESLTYAYYHSVLKGKTPPKAVSYIAGDPDSAVVHDHGEKKQDGAAKDISSKGASSATSADGSASSPRIAWRCTLCGYIEEGYPDGLPDDYRCPWCGAGAEMFERIEL